VVRKWSQWPLDLAWTSPGKRNCILGYLDKYCGTAVLCTSNTIKVVQPLFSSSVLCFHQPPTCIRRICKTHNNKMTIQKIPVDSSYALLSVSEIEKRTSHGDEHPGCETRSVWCLSKVRTLRRFRASSALAWPHRGTVRPERGPKARSRKIKLHCQWKVENGKYTRK